MAHTPGPWPKDYVHEAVRHIARNCDFITSETDPEFGWDRYNDADLIAASPELLAACKAVLDEDELDGGGYNVLMQVRDAIAKTEGE